MSKELQRLARGSYDVLLDGTVIASLVRSGESQNATWTVELLEEMPPVNRPGLLTETEHAFGSLEAAREWLGITEIFVTRD